MLFSFEFFIHFLIFWNSHLNNLCFQIFKSPVSVGVLILVAKDILKAMTTDDTSTNSTVESRRVGTSWFFLHSSLIPDCLVGSGPTYDSTVELGWLMCHGLNNRFCTCLLGVIPTICNYVNPAK